MNLAEKTMSYRTLLVAFVAALMLTLVACDGGSESTPTPAGPPAIPAVPATQPATPDAASSKADGYPIDVCILSGEKLGSMGDPIVMNHEGTEVRLCCAGCVDEFKKNPAKYVAKLAAAKATAGH